MSSIDKILVQGVRSFGPEDSDKQIVKFFHPLTLILGQNGCGKTTIIESLKYVTTGDMPPGCGRGGSFVHDPKLSKEVQVRGQVKLSFFDLAKKQVVVTRSLEATQKAKKLEVRTLDGIISRKNEIGEPVQLSSKCAELDTEICSMLGVSKAILNNVIFCHQEDSNWPLEEGKKVKDKFDAIFNATRYIKCLEEIKKSRAVLKQDVNKMETELSYLKDNKEQAETMKKELQGQEIKLAANRDAIKRIQEQLEPLKNKLIQIQEKEGSVVKLKSEIETFEMRLEELQRNQQELLKHLNGEPTESVTELERLKRNFSIHVKEKERKLDESYSEQKNIDRDIRRIESQRESKLTNVGKLRGDRERHMEILKSRDGRICLLGQQLNVSGLSSQVELSDTDVQRTVVALEGKVHDVKMIVSNTEKDFGEREKQVQEKLDKLKEQKTRLEEGIKMKEKQIWEQRQELEETEDRLEELSSSTASKEIEDIDIALTIAEDDLNTEQERIDSDMLERDLHDSEKERKIIEQEITKVSNNLTKKSGVLAELEHLKNDKRIKEENSRRLLNRHEDTLKHVFGEIPKGSLKHTIHNKLMTLETEISQKRERFQKKQKELSTLETRYQHMQDEIQKKEQQIKAYENQIFRVCGSQDYEQFLAKVKKSIDEDQEQKSDLQGSEHAYKTFLAKLKKPRDPSCPLCHRPFGDQDEAQDLIIEVENLIREIPRKIDMYSSRLEQHHKTHQQLIEIKPVKEALSKLQDFEMPEIRTEAITVEERKCLLEEEVSRLESDLETVNSNVSTVRALTGDAALWDQQQMELKRLQQQIQTKEKMTGGQSLSELENLHKSLTDDLEKQRNHIDQIRKELEKYRKSVQEHKDNIAKLQKVKMELLDKQKEHIKLEQKQKNLRESLQKLSQEVHDDGGKVQPLHVELREITSQKNSVLEERKQKLSILQNDVDKWITELKEVENMNNTIECYIREGQDRKLAETEQEIQKLDNRISNLRANIQTVSSRIDEFTKDLSNQKIEERRIEDALKYVKDQESLAEFKLKLHQKRAELGGFDVRGILEERDKLRKKYEDLKTESISKEGGLHALQDGIYRLERDLNKEQFRTAEKKHKTKYIQSKVTSLACEDLNKYYIALDWSVMHFHKEKMKMINQIIRELWKTTYRGNDIDYIEIRTDETDSSAGADKRRTYNYRVIMVKNEVEMDMRGRCSAGQKVLASLIIRMALAETFALKCGILALDEPTTNLDRENIESLSLALIDIANKRAEQSNFQLIVITHDEEFLEKLTHVDFIDFFYKVSRNERGLSVIRKMPVEKL